MSKKLRFTTAIIICLIIVAAVCLAGCSDGGSDSAEPASSGSAFTGDKYVSDADGLLTVDEMPDGYEFVPNDKFEKAYLALVDGEVSSYAEVAEAFGDDGIRMDGNTYGDGAYTFYSWYSDKDYVGDSKVSVFVTFKNDGDNLKFYAWSSNGILPEDVR